MLSTEGLAYAPFTAAIRRLVRECGAEEVAAAHRLALIG